MKLKECQEMPVDLMITDQRFVAPRYSYHQHLSGRVARLFCRYYRLKLIGSFVFGIKTNILIHFTDEMEIGVKCSDRIETSGHGIIDQDINFINTNPIFY